MAHTSDNVSFFMRGHQGIEITTASTTRRLLRPSPFDFPRSRRKSQHRELLKLSDTFIYITPLQSTADTTEIKLVQSRHH